MNTPDIDIELKNLSKRYPRQPELTLHDISLQVQRGELLALLGPSGSGKSTILKLIAGIEEPDGGDIFIEGQSVRHVPTNRRGAVLMFQKAYLFPYMNVMDNIGFGLKVQGAKQRDIRAAVGRMLDLVGLPGVERKYPNQLSGGEQQRVALARALVTEPCVLLLDEPLSSLDTAVRQTLQESIRRIQREVGITTILVTHDLHEAITMSDRIALLLDGMIETIARPETLFRRPPTRQAAQFVGISTFFQGTIRGDTFCTECARLRLPAELHANGTAQAATLAIRPEHMHLCADGDVNALSGQVVDAVYKGEFTVYRVKIGDTEVRVHDYQAPLNYAPGAPVCVRVPPEHLFAVDAQAGE